MVLALDRVNTDGAIYSAGQAPSVPNGAQHATASAGTGKPSFYGGSQGWDTVRRIFNPHRSECWTSTFVWKCLDSIQIFRLVLKECLLKWFFFSRLKPLLLHVHFERPVQFTALCTSSGIWLLACHAEEEKQQHPVQLWQTIGLDDWASSTLCCCTPEGQGLHCFTGSNISVWQTAWQWASFNPGQTWFTQEHYRQGNAMLMIFSCVMHCDCIVPKLTVSLLMDVMPHSNCFTSLACQVSAVPHRGRLPSTKASYVLLVVRKSGPPQLPTRSPSVRSLGTIAHLGKRWTRNHPQRRKSSHLQKRPWKCHLRPKFKPTKNATVTAVTTGCISSIQSEQVCWIAVFALENKERWLISRQMR